MTKDHSSLRKLPDAPGVYFFLGKRKEILYIGKATSLKNRVKSYFAKDLKEKRSPLIANMVMAATQVEYTVTDSVLEALILEANLIRTHKPRYNTISKDDKSYNHLIVTNEEWPRLLLVRGKDLTEKYTEKEIKHHFGPYPSSASLREALKIIRRLFKYYDTNVPIGKEKTKMSKGKVDFNRQIGLYPEKEDKHAYQRTITHLRYFFEGKKQKILAELRKDMMRAAKREAFETANELKKQIFALEHIQDIALIRDDSRIFRDDRHARIEAYDVAHLQGKEMVGVMTVVEAGEPKNNEYRKFKIQSLTGANDPAALREVLERRLKHPEWSLPQIIVVDGSTAQKNAAEHVLRKLEILIPVVGVVKNKQHKPERIIGSKKLIAQYENDILLANAEAHRFAINFHRDKLRKRNLLK